MSKTKQAGTAGQAAALPKILTPVQLLQQLDVWLRTTGHGDVHPWRLSIAATLGAHAGAEPAGSAAGVNLIFEEIAGKQSDLVDLLGDLLCGDGSNWEAAFSTARHVGWLADVAAQAHGGTLHMRPEEWLLPPGGVEVLRAARAAAAAKGGAA